MKICYRQWNSTGAPNSCSYADIAVASIDQAIMEEKEIAFPEIIYFGRYRCDCLVLWDGTDEKLQELYYFINTLNPDLTYIYYGNWESIIMLLRFKNLNC